MHCQEINLSCEVVSFKNVNPQSTEEFVHKEFERQTNKTLSSVMSSATLLIIDEGQNVFRFSFWTQLKAVLNPSEEQCSVICCSAFDANRVMGTLVSPVCFLENLKFNLDFLCFDGDEIDDLIVIFKKRYADRDYRLFSERILKLLGDSSKGIPGLFYAALDLLFTAVSSPSRVFSFKKCIRTAALFRLTTWKALIVVTKTQPKFSRA